MVWGFIGVGFVGFSTHSVAGAGVFRCLAQQWISHLAL